MQKYQCVECNAEYDQSTIPSSHVCQLDSCPGNGLTGLIVEITGGGVSQSQGSASIQIKEIGLCVLLMDASGSMFNDSAFKGTSFPSQFGGKYMNKAEMIALCAANAIFQLKDISIKDHQEAYILAIKFDHRQEVMFHKPVNEIISQHGEASNFAKYLYEQFQSMGGGTNINGALNMAHSFINKFKSGNIPGIGDFEPMYDSIFLPNKNGDYEIPNIRTLIYTDGEQLEDYGEIVNPFKNEDPDLLMGAFIGNDSEDGCEDLRSVIGDCPIHNSKQFFLIDNPQKQATLRRLFRMASDTSGFCPNCIAPSELR